MDPILSSEDLIAQNYLLYEVKELHPIEDLDLIVPFKEWASYPSKFVLVDQAKFENLLSDIYDNNFLTTELLYAAEQAIYQIDEKNYKKASTLGFKSHPLFQLNIVESCLRQFDTIFKLPETPSQIIDQLKDITCNKPELYFLSKTEELFFASRNLLPCKFRIKNYEVLSLLDTDQKTIYLSALRAISSQPYEQRLISTICKTNLNIFPNLAAIHLFLYIDIPIASKILCCSEIKIEQMISENKIKAYTSRSPTGEELDKIPLYEILLLIKDNPTRFPISYKEVSDIVLDSFSQKYHPDIDKNDFYMGTEAISALKLKLHEQETENYNLRNEIKKISERPSIRKYSSTIEKSVELLVKIMSENRTTDHPKWTKNDFLNEIKKSCNPHNQLVELIFKQLPQKYRATAGERSKRRLTS